MQSLVHFFLWHLQAAHAGRFSILSCVVMIVLSLLLLSLLFTISYFLLLFNELRKLGLGFSNPGFCISERSIRKGNYLFCDVIN
jgi:hypothetical protein